MSRNRRLEEQISQLLAQLKPRAKSLIVTIYGDAILPHGGSVWLGSLIRLVEPFGLAERIVRTAVFRLSKDEWLGATQLGRRSYYSLTEAGRHRFEAAHRRIYGPLRRAWDGEWTLVITTGCDGDEREPLRRELSWLGFGSIAPTVMAHPTPDTESVQQVLKDTRGGEKVVVMRAATDRVASPATLRGLVRGCWDFDRLGSDYVGFLERFRPILRTLQADSDLDPEMCFAVRELLIHDYRRVLLRDPMLPEELLPPDWVGAAARVLCRNLYRITQEPAERHLMTALETADGPLPEAAPFFYARFGGLPETPFEERPQERVTG